MGPIWGRQDSGGPHVGPINFVIWDLLGSWVPCNKTQNLYQNTHKKIVKKMLLKYAACKFRPFCYVFLVKLEYFGQTRSILQQLMSWLLTFPGHHQPCYWLWSTGHCFPWRKILMAWTISKLRNCTTCEYIFMFPKMNSALQVLTDWGQVTHICIGKPTSLVQIMACHLVGAKPLLEPML